MAGVEKNPSEISEFWECTTSTSEDNTLLAEQPEGTTTNLQASHVKNCELEDERTSFPILSELVGTSQVVSSKVKQRSANMHKYSSLQRRKMVKLTTGVPNKKEDTDKGLVALPAPQMERKQECQLEHPKGAYTSFDTLAKRRDVISKRGKRTKIQSKSAPKGIRVPSPSTMPISLQDIRKARLKSLEKTTKEKPKDGADQRTRRKATFSPSLPVGKVKSMENSQSDLQEATKDKRVLTRGTRSDPLSSPNSRHKASSKFGTSSISLVRRHKPKERRTPPRASSKRTMEKPHFQIDAITLSCTKDLGVSPRSISSSSPSYNKNKIVPKHTRTKASSKENTIAQTSKWMISLETKALLNSEVSLGNEVPQSSIEYPDPSDIEWSLVNFGSTKRILRSAVPETPHTSGSRLCWFYLTPMAAVMVTSARIQELLGLLTHVCPKKINSSPCKECHRIDLEHFTHIFLLSHELLVSSRQLIWYLHREYTRKREDPEKQFAVQRRISQVLSTWIDLFRVHFVSNTEVTRVFTDLVRKQVKQIIRKRSNDSRKRKTTAAIVEEYESSKLHMWRTKGDRNRQPYGISANNISLFAVASKVIHLANKEAENKVNSEEENPPHAESTFSGIRLYRFSSSSGSVISPRSGQGQVSLASWSTQDMAEQLTLFHFEAYCCISVVEALQYLKVQHSKQLSESTPHISAMIKGFNDLSFWIQEEILLAKSAKGRSKRIKKALSLGKHLLRLRNYHGLMAVISAISGHPVGRLAHSWAMVEDKQHTLKDQLISIFDPRKNMSNYRKKLTAHSPPCVPFLGVFLKDLTIANELEEYQDKEASTINVGRLQAFATIFSSLLQHQKGSYRSRGCRADQSIQRYIRCEQHMDNDLLLNTCDYAPFSVSHFREIKGRIKKVHSCRMQSCLADLDDTNVLTWLSETLE